MSCLMLFNNSAADQIQQNLWETKAGINPTYPVASVIIITYRIGMP